MRAMVPTAVTTMLLLVGLSGQALGQDGALSFDYVRIHADTVGASRFADEGMALAPVDPGRGIQPTPASAPIGVTGLVFLCPPSGASADWHPAPRRQFNVILSGEHEVEVSDGEVRRFTPGSVLLVEDTAGRGHRTRVFGDGEGCFAAVSLAAARVTDGPAPDALMGRRGRERVSGTLEPTGLPLEGPVRIAAGASCVVEVKQAYDIAGDLTGSLEIDYRILVAGPCGSPAGTFDEEWIAYGTFTGAQKDTQAAGSFSYTAHVEAGGDVEGRIVLGQGLAGTLSVNGNFADGGLSYDGWVARD